MKSKKKRLWTIIIIVLVIAGATVGALTSKRKDTRTAVTTEGVEYRRLISTVSAEGEVEPVDQVKISAEIPGRITELPVKEGEMVTKGQFLVELDPKTYAANRESAQSMLRSARASRDKAEADLKRVRELVTKGMASQADLDAALAGSELAAGELDRAVAGEKSARESLYKTRIDAPMSGTISRLNKEIGELTLGSQFQEDVIMVIADLTKMQVRSQVDENDITGVKLGDSALVEIDAYPDTSFRGIVTEISQSATQAGQLGSEQVAKNFDVKIAIVDTILGIRPGMSATVDIATDKRDHVLSVSLQCVALRDKEEGKVVELTEKKEKKSARQVAAEVKSGTADSSLFKREQPQEGVFIFAKDSAVWRPVQTGLSSDRYMEILGGLSEGDSVVNGPYSVLARDLKHGDKIKLKAKDEKGKGAKGGK
ncbi:efflux RND transporter periplasmic adaptor subunit [candidate division KSB1 bacterium]|nr:efflux RND transporter periplasmic adaptor subunit [candidate division KSB1 bacterium]